MPGVKNRDIRELYLRVLVHHPLGNKMECSLYVIFIEYFDKPTVMYRAVVVAHRESLFLSVLVQVFDSHINYLSSRDVPRDFIKKYRSRARRLRLSSAKIFYYSGDCAVAVRYRDAVRRRLDVLRGVRGRVAYVGVFYH